MTRCSREESANPAQSDPIDSFPWDRIKEWLVVRLTVVTIPYSTTQRGGYLTEDHHQRNS
jgi:hypothetical protein